jgi:hypothetical protein
MQYMCLIYGDEQTRLSMSEADRNQMIGDYGAFTESIRQGGNMLAGDALQPTTTATTVRVRKGETLVTDGPFAETKEQLGSSYRLSSRAGLEPATSWVRFRRKASPPASILCRVPQTKPLRGQSFPSFATVCRLYLTKL